MVSKKRNAKGAVRKRTEALDEQLRAARARENQRARTGGDLANAPSHLLFSVDAKRSPKTDRRARLDKPLHVERNVAPNPRVKPVTGAVHKRKPKPDKAPAARAIKPVPVVATKAEVREARRLRKEREFPDAAAPPPAASLADVWSSEPPALPRRRTNATPEAPGARAAQRAVEPVPEGASFNPDPEAHDQLVHRMVDYDVEKKRRERMPSMTGRSNLDSLPLPSSAAMAVSRLSAAAPDDDGASGDELEAEEGTDYAGAPRAATENKKLTIAQRNRQRLGKERRAAERAAKEEKKRKKQLDRIDPLLSEVRQEQKSLERRQRADEERKLSRRKRLGKARVAPARPEVVLEPPDALRQLPTAKPLLEERYHSITSRNLVEVRKAATKTKSKRATVRMVTTEGHKDRRFTSPFYQKSGGEIPVWV